MAPAAVEVLKATDCRTLAARERSCEQGGQASHVLASQPTSTTHGLGQPRLEKSSLPSCFGAFRNVEDLRQDAGRGVEIEAFHALRKPWKALLAEGRLGLSEAGSSNRRDDSVTRDFHEGLQEL